MARHKIPKKSTITKEEARQFIEVFCRAKTYAEVAEKLNREVSEVMYTAQILRTDVPSLPYLKVVLPDNTLKTSEEITERIQRFENSTRRDKYDGSNP